jgi:predicted nucleotidyltransferase
MKKREIPIWVTDFERWVETSRRLRETGYVGEEERLREREKRFAMLNEARRRAWRNYLNNRKPEGVPDRWFEQNWDKYVGIPKEEKAGQPKNYDFTYHQVLSALKIIFKKHGWKGYLIGRLAREGHTQHDIDIYLEKGIKNNGVNHEEIRSALSIYLGRDVDLWYYNDVVGGVVNVFTKDLTTIGLERENG